MGIPDSSFKDLAKQVYNIEPSKAKSNDTDIIYEGKTLLDGVTLKKYQVIAVQDNNNDADPTNDNGMQAMAVAPVENGEVDTSQIIIAFAGTNTDDARDLGTDFQNILINQKLGLITDIKPVFSSMINDHSENSVVLPNLLMPTPAPALSITGSETQLESSLQFYYQLKKDFPNSNFSFTGHSLGGFIALFVAVKTQWPATVFNAPNAGRLLTMQEIIWVKKNQELYNSFRINSDLIGNFGAYFGVDILGVSKGVNGPYSIHDIIDNHDVDTIFANHDIDAFRFNSKGQLIDENGKVIGTQYLDSHFYDNLVSSKEKMKHFKTLKKRWQESGGRLSGAEKLFLDAAQGQILASSMAKTARAGADQVSDFRTTANEAVQAIWNAIDFSSYNELTYYEVKSIFADEGITYDKFVNSFHSYTDAITLKMTSLAEDFETLDTEIQTVIDSKVALDDKLAGEFKAWQEEL
ncbi:hypothetical protein [Streptococcus sp. CSL10205-OR2]|uniref:hypothetical protein n=1 Tax=Streptococcus sp. CSL10205-OR2 TaxID=2980558 RepID=UPI0021DA7160|nr:hypothetical protein [Streptococcus sp. CSL10205-OR2]MCU9533543.1 hypothetical protein [Streptococcus sp. CSL10205-OR2]